MKNRTLLLAALSGFLFATSSLLALDPPIVLDPPAVMDVLSKEGVKSDIRYIGQPAKGGKIDLTATNGFFDRCFEALDPMPGIAGDTYIRGSFGYLKRMSDKVAGTARWHLWCADAGEIKATFFMQVPADEAKHPWVITVGDETHVLKANQNDGESPQKQTLTFKIKTPGKITFTIDCTKNPPPAETRLFYIRLEGSAVAKASVLRTRWRPLAVHARYYAPKDCPPSRMWVFETVPVSKVSSYSPLTTPFGYYGAIIKDGGKIGGGFNFSVWIAGKGAAKAPPIDKMPRLIATDLPDAKFGSWGGEGTGVRLGGTAYPNGADRTIQALRVEADKSGLMTYHGYFYDEEASRWKLWVSAQRFAKKLGGKENPNFGTMNSTGSFSEIPGPPNRERSGDVVREIKRRGWFLGNDMKWYRAGMGDLLNEDAPKEAKGDPNQINSKRTYYMDDFAKEGWMSMATGGIEYHLVSSNVRNLPPKGSKPGPLPEYLSPEKTAQLFELPVMFGKSNATLVAKDQAAIDYEIKKTGPNSKAILYYGTVDCLTYSPQMVTKGSPVQIEMYSPERTWQAATPEQKVTAGMNQFRLEKLKSDTTYYYRLYVTHDVGKSWDFQSGNFKTR